MTSKILKVEFFEFCFTSDETSYDSLKAVCVCVL